MSSPWAIGWFRSLWLLVSLFLEQRRLAAVKVWGVARTARPTSFVGAVVNSQLSWPVDAAVWRPPCVLHGRVFRGDLAIAPEAYPFCLPLACGLVHGGGPLHVAGGKFPPRCI